MAYALVALLLVVLATLFVLAFDPHGEVDHDRTDEIDLGSLGDRR